MAYEGKIKSYLDYINKKVLSNLSNRDLINFNEKYIKVILFAYIVDSKVYKPYSEPEVENGYLDIYLEKDHRIPDVKYEWLIELKYLKEIERKQLEQVKKEGFKQLQEYAVARKFQDKKNLKQALIIFIGKSDYKLFVRS